MIVPGGYVVRYQPEGPNEKPRMAWIDLAKVPDPRAVRGPA